VVLAGGDATALAFAAAARRLDARIAPIAIATDSHGFARTGDMQALERVIRAQLALPGERRETET